MPQAQDSDPAQANGDRQHPPPAPIPLPLSLLKRPGQPEAFSISLQSLPLRPSTLTALIRSGFSTTGDVMNSCRTAMTPVNDAHHDGPGSNAGVENYGVNHDNTNANDKDNDNNNSFSNFAKDLVCSSSQAADYAHEIDDALGSVGLPQTMVASNETDVDGKNERLHGTGGDNNTMTPHRSIFPATAASILRLKGNGRSPTGGGRNESRHVVSFSQPLDRLLGGGFARSELTEIVGPPGAGKTQLAMQLCVDARLPSTSGGVDGHAVVIDAEGGWGGASGGERLWSMAVALVDHARGSAERRLGARRAQGAPLSEKEIASQATLSRFTPEYILEGIHVFRVHDETSQTCTLYNLPDFLLSLEERGTPAKLVVVDSLAFHYRVALSSSSYGNGNSGSGKSNSLSTTHNLTRIAAFLTQLASEFDLAVVAINHLTTRIEKDANGAVGRTKLVPALGESWAHSITSRLMIDHYHALHNASPSANADGFNEVRTATLVKSPHKPNGMSLFMITDKGIRGVPPHLLQSLENKRPRLN